MSENIFNHCEECIDLDIPIYKCSNLERYKKIFDIFKKNSLLPNELILKIIELSVTYDKCSFCDTKLCGYHTQRAEYYGKYYKNYECKMCNSCCWREVTQ